MEELLKALDIVKAECKKHEKCQACPFFSPESEISICGLASVPHTWGSLDKNFLNINSI